MFENAPVYWDLFLKFLTATILSGAIGLEREYHGRAAGLRTHILVCLASTAIMSISQAAQVVFESQGAESVFRIDPWRLAAGIVTGIVTLIVTGIVISGCIECLCMNAQCVHIKGATYRCQIGCHVHAVTTHCVNRAGLKYSRKPGREHVGSIVNGYPQVVNTYRFVNVG